MKAMLFAAIVAAGISGAAEADVFRYINTDAVATNGDDQTFFIDNVLVIDEDLYFGGMIGGSTLSLITSHIPPDYGIVSSGGETYTYVRPSGTGSWSAIGIMEFISPAADRPVAYASGITIRFATDGSVLSSGGSVTMGGSADYSFGDGDWTVERISPAPVPLPSTAPLLLAGAAALIGIRRRGRARKDELTT